MIFKELKCRACGEVFETFVREGESPRCPKCGSEDVATHLSGGTCNKPGHSCSGNCKTCGGCH